MEMIPSNRQIKSGHASNDNEDKEDDEDIECDDNNNEDGEGDDNKNKDREDDDNGDSGGRDPSRTSTDIVVKSIRFDNYNLKMLMDVHEDLEGDMWLDQEFAVMIGLNYHSPPRIGGAKSKTKGDDLINCGGGYTLLGAGGGYTSAVEDVRHQKDTPYILGRSSAVGASKVPFCACEFLKCNENMNILLSKIDVLTEAQGVTEEAINKLIYKRDINLSSRISEPFTPIGVKRRRNQNSKALTGAKRKATNTPKMMDDQPTKRLRANIYKYGDDKKKNKIQQMIKTKRSTKILCTIPEFNYLDFDCMTDMDRGWEDWLKQSLDDYKFSDYFLNYCKGARPYPGGVPWLGAKRMMTLDKKYFIALELLINEGVINVYDCNIPFFPEDDFFLQIQKDLPKNDIGATCGPYSLAFIELLITNSSMNLLNDNTIERMRWRWAVGVVSKDLVS
ncbi:hypothetical protein HAX54_017180 [Datura stramonium]|uniref:Ubiquitin-like protease family profile domain-containing protein n=1 Tax=Datura stramonium TaxID=4076 RepID=A0ABS8UKG2_DATST|nr:hypothetical protein [Datura stramonium]